MKTKITILGLEVDNISLHEVEQIIDKKISSQENTKPLFFVTAYSEFFLEAQKNPLFLKALQKADYVLADGVSVLEAVEYLTTPATTVVSKFLLGMQVGLKTLLGTYSARITGVGLVRKLLLEKKCKILLVGGWDGVGEKLARIYGCEAIGGPRSITRASEKENNELILAINAKKADVILVSFGRYNQEIWIASNKDKLQAKVVMGVGSAFDEILGEGKWAKKVPAWIERAGLKWLWRITIDPTHIKRIPHVPQFAWAVFLQKIKSA